MQPDQRTKAERFRALHDGPPFVLPNPWDVGSAVVLAALGAPALATTSSGFSYALGRPDGGATLDELLAHVREVDAATPLPVSVDLEDGHGDAPRAIRLAAEAGAVAGSIEDWSADGGFLETGAAAERVASAVDAARGLGFQFLVTARAENHFRGRPDLDDTIARLRAYEEAGADVLYAPGLEAAAEIAAVCAAVSRPVNVLARPGLSAADVFAAGAQRISIGGQLTWVAAGAMADAARRILEDGDLSVLRPAVPARHIAAWLA